MRPALLAPLMLLAACSSCGSTPEVELRGATERLSVRDVSWAGEDREQLRVDLAYEGGPVHDVIVLMYAGDERVAVDGIPGAIFTEPGRIYRRRLPAVTARRTEGAEAIRARIADTTRVLLHVSETEEQAREVVRDAELLGDGPGVPGAQ